MRSDEENMGRILQVLHDSRHDDLVNFNEVFLPLQIPKNILRSNLSRLEQKGLIDWKSNEVGGFGLGKIRDYGIEVVEKKRQPPIPIIFHQVHIHGSTNVVIGQGNTQNITFEMNSLIAAIDKSDATPAEKTAAKSLVEKITENPLLNTIVGGIIKGAMA